MRSFVSRDLKFGDRSVRLVCFCLVYLWAFLTRREERRERVAEIILYALKMSWKNGVVILLMLLPTILLISMDQGADLIANLLLPDSFLSGWGRTVWFMAVLTMSCYAVWAIPQFYIDFEVENTPPEDRQVSSNYIRILGSLPFVIFGIAIFGVTEVCHINMTLYFVLNIIIGGFIFLLGIHYYYVGKGMSFFFRCGAFLILLMPAFFAYFHSLDFAFKEEFANAFLGNVLLALTVCTYAAMKRWERKFEHIQPTGSKMQLDQMESNSRYLYSILLGITILVVLYFSLYGDNMLYVATIPIFTMVFTLYIFLFQLLAYWFKTMNATGKFGLVLVVGIILWTMFADPSRPHAVYLVEKKHERDSLEDYTGQWLAQFKASLDTGSLRTIYLVAGEGGGSRGGLWFSSVYAGLDAAMGGTLRKQTFAMSTVSGSSVGASLLTKLYRIQHDLDTREHAIYPEDFAKNFFTSNFVTGSLFDLFYKDFIRQLWPRRQRSGRNLRLQREEWQSLEYALKGTSVPSFALLRKMTFPDIDYIMLDDNRKVRNYQFAEFSSLWRTDNEEYYIDIPLTFFNTTYMPTGQPLVLSPFRFDFNAYYSYHDLITYFESKATCGDLAQKTIGVGTASNMSELFPFFSAFTHVDCLGHVMDGGGYDNSGTHTLLMVYQYLKDKIRSDSLLNDKVRIMVIYISNGNGTRPAEIKERVHSKTQLSAMLGQSLKQPFQAITPDAVNALTKEVNQNLPDTFITISLQHMLDSYTCCSDRHRKMRYQDLPTARDLSKETIDVIIEAAENAVARFTPKISE